MIFALSYWEAFLVKIFTKPLQGLGGRGAEPYKGKKGVKKDFFFKCIIIAFLILTAVLFFLFYPVISGYPVAYEYKESLRWLSGWAF